MSSQLAVTRRSAKIGLAALIGVWFTGATSVPFTSVLYKLHRISAEEILAIRSVACALLALFLSRGLAWRTAPIVIRSGAVIALSSVLFYRTLAEWQIAPTITMLSLIPLASLVLERMRGLRPKISMIFSVLVVIAGTAWALEPWKTPLSVTGWILSLSMVMVSAIGFDLWSRVPEDTTISQQVFWLSAWAVAFSVIIMMIGRLAPVTQDILSDPHAYLYMIGYVITIIPYIFFSIVPYSKIGKLNVVHTNVIMAVGAPLTFVGGNLIAHEHIRANQWYGMILALIAGTYISIESVRAHQSSTLTPHR